ncbi:MAG: protein translocase subunit SecF [Candidatus Wildermuthbacteria bacterium]|nr:protein translocase subunit SecF [Candidatus Wildermuthbacteria bacterium]
MNILRFDRFYLRVGILAIASSIVALVAFGLKPGIDFAGGSELVVEYQNARPQSDEIRRTIDALSLGTAHVQPLGERQVVIRMNSLTPDAHQHMVRSLGEGVSEQKFESVGPSVGKELRNKIMQMALISLAVIMAYVTVAFRKIVEYARSWQYGVTVLLTALHDVLIPAGVFAVLGRFYGVEITIPVVVALLTVLGYSINDTIVVFDRIRENVVLRSGADFRDIVNASLSQTMVRCLNTYLTTLFPLVALYMVGGESLRYFSLALIVGIVAGIYSSLCLAPAFLVRWTARNLTK